MDFRIGTGGISYTNVSQAKQDKKVERQSFQGSLEKVIQNQKMTQPQDSIEISEESDFKKLEKLKELNDATDFSGMTKLEKFATIHERYEKAFPDLKARMNVGAGIKVNADIQEQYFEQLKKNGITHSEIGDLYRAYKGYDKMTDEQKWESIQKEYGNPQNGIEQVCALTEMSQAKLVDWDVVSRMISKVLYQSQHIASEEKGYNFVTEYYSDMNNMAYREKFGYQMPYEYLQNNKVDFNSISQKLKSTVKFDDPQVQKEFNYEVDYITELMNALEGRKD